MTLFHLVRHATHDLVGHVLTGRHADVSLSDKGQAQAGALADHLSRRKISVVLSSPLKRTLETAQPIAARCGVALSVEPRLDEIDFGTWVGQGFAALNARPDWRDWNAFRSGQRTPGGETMIEAQARIVAAMLDARDRWQRGEIVLVSHGDMIKAALAYWAGIPLDLFRRVEISPASISRVLLDGSEVSILGVNHTVESAL